MNGIFFFTFVSSSREFENFRSIIVKKRRIVTKEVTFIITSGTLDRINHSVANEAVEQKALCDKEASLRPRGGIIYLPGAS